jgi:hypothetical protein
MLSGVRPALDDASAQALDHFWAAKGRLDNAGDQADQVGQWVDALVAGQQ